MYLLTHVGLGRQAGDITPGRIRRERKSNSLMHADNDHDSAVRFLEVADFAWSLAATTTTTTASLYTLFVSTYCKRLGYAYSCACV